MRNVLLGLAVSCTLAACTTSSGPAATLSVENASDFQIVEIYLTDIGSSSWGPNLISGDTLNPGETLRLGVDCSTYDAKLIDETNVSCEVDNLDLCLNDSVWIINNNTCTAFSNAAKERAAKKAAEAAAQPPAQ
ncbi:MAG: hypothetical protein ABJE66_35150 [Deltaproteobacteria bacterium]